MNEHQLILKLSRYELNIIQLKNEIKDLEEDKRRVTTPAIVAVIINAIKAKEAKIERIQSEVKRLRA